MMTRLIVANLAAIGSNLLITIAIPFGVFRNVGDVVFLIVLLGCAATAWVTAFILSRRLS